MGEEGVEESFAVPAGVAEADAEAGRSGVCCSLLAREGTIRWHGFRDSDMQEVGSDSQQTALGLRNR